MATVLSGPFGQITLEQAAYTIGSAPSNPIVIPDAKVLPTQAHIQFDGQGYSILDWGGGIGTYLNGQRLAPNTLTPVRGNGQILFGDTTCYYEVTPQPSTWWPPVNSLDNQGEQLPYPTWNTPAKSSFQPKGPRWVLPFFLALALLVVLASAGTFLYITTRPKPVINLASNYTTNAYPVGATATTFHITGHNFSDNSSITFFLDQQPLSGISPVLSDGSGNISVTIIVTAAWRLGKHLLTASDADGYVTKAGIPIIIVLPGQDSTPGPNGAPSDTASGTVLVTLQTSNGTGTLILTIMGASSGGTVCRDVDDGRPHAQVGISNGVSYTETAAATCSGSYKEGKLIYTETIISDQLVFTNGLTCTAQVPYVGRRLEGTFNSPTTISGTYSSDMIAIHCNKGIGATPLPAQSGTWSGLAAM